MNSTCLFNKCISCRGVSQDYSEFEPRRWTGGQWVEARVDEQTDAVPPTDKKELPHTGGQASHHQPLPSLLVIIIAY